MGKQVAELSQRDRAAEWVTYGKNVEDWNWETIFTDIIWSIFNHCDVIGHQSNRIRLNKRKIRDKLILPF